MPRFAALLRVLGAFLVLTGALATYAVLTKGSNPPPINCDIGNPIDVHEREECGFTLTVGR